VEPEQRRAARHPLAHGRHLPLIPARRVADKLPPATR
jgi:hypothetical protein